MMSRARPKSLDEWIEAEDLTLAEAAERLDVHVSQLSEWRRGIRPIPVRVWRRLSLKTGLPFTAFYPEDLRNA